MRIGGDVIGSASLVKITVPEDLAWLANKLEGCYFIFTSMLEKTIPCLSSDGYKCFQNSIEKDGVAYRCLYNGKGKGIRERLTTHLFNESTLNKALSCENAKINISDTGALSLDTMDESQAQLLKKRGQYDSNKCRLKRVRKSIQAGSHLQHDEKLYFLNGIDIREPHWHDVSWAVCVVQTDSEFGKILVEEAFSRKNGRPPLCRRHG